MNQRDPQFAQTSTAALQRILIGHGVMVLICLWAAYRYGWTDNLRLLTAITLFVGGVTAVYYFLRTD